MFISNVSVDDNSQLFETPKKKNTLSLHQGTRFCWVMMMLSSLSLPE